MSDGASRRANPPAFQIPCCKDVSTMALVPRTGYCALFAISPLFVFGCSLPRGSVANTPTAPTTTQAAAPQGNSPGRLPQTASAKTASTTPTARQAAPQAPPPAVLPASHQQSVPAVATEHGVYDDGLFGNEPELSLPYLTELIMQRNASLQAMTFAWRSATQRYPQAIALDDPIFMGMIAPGSVSSSTVETGYQVGASQKLPWFGKRAARGAAAAADASAMFHDVRDARLQLAQTARSAYFEYYLVARELEINRANLKLTQDFRSTAQSKYENNQVSEQDVLQADVEFATTERRLLEFERMDRIARARLNTLLRREPGSWLPPPPTKLDDTKHLPPVEMLRQIAMAQRPDLAAISSRVRSEQAAVELANRQFYPDTELYGRYDTFWQPADSQGPLRGQVGVNMNMPIYRNKLKAAVSEAEFRLSQRQAEYRQKQVDIQYEVESAYAQVAEAEKALVLYQNKLLPAAEQTVATIRANYDAGATTFLNLLTAQQQLLLQREQYQQTVAAYQLRLAELERAVGEPIPEMAPAEQISAPLPD